MPENNLVGRLTPGDLKLANFWVRNRLMLRRVGYGLLIGVSVLLWGYVAWSLLDAYAISYPRESRIVRDVALNLQQLAALESDRPQEVSISDVAVLQTTDNRLDLSVDISNPNPQWWAEFTYRFSVSGEQTPLRSGYVLPNGTQILTELGYRPTGPGGGSANLEVENVRWHRVDPSFVGANYDAFRDHRMRIAAEDITFDTDIDVSGRPVGQTSFTLVNQSAYGFWSVDLVLRVYRGSSVIGVSKIAATKLTPGERRPMRVVWIEPLPGVTKTEIISQVNILDRTAFLPTQYFE